MNIVLSVIVPIYNSEECIERCVQSLLLQDYSKMEIILVDDGSTDNSGKICEKLAGRDTRVKAYHTENRGSVAARNYGVSLAQGKVITFVDSDDWIEPDMYSHMMSAYGMYEPDIISSGLIIDDMFGTRTTEYDLIPEGVYEEAQIKQEIIPTMMYDAERYKRAVTPSVCTKIIRKDLWNEVARTGDSRITYGEDAALSYLCLAKARKAVFMNKVWYHYCVSDNSMVHNFDINSFEKIKIFMDYMEKAYKELGIWTQMETQLKEYVKSFLYPAIKNVFDIKLDDPIYLFPYDLVKSGSQIVLYGAGKVGRSYMENLERTNYARVEAWVDKAYHKYTDLKGKIGSPRLLWEICFDYVVIAIENDEVAQVIQKDLFNMGVDRGKIVWKKPERLNG